MNQFSVSEVAFSGYRLLRARPATAAAWFVFYLLVTLFTIAATVTLAGPQLAMLQEIKASGQIDPTTMMALTSQLMPYYAFSMIFPLVVACVAGAAASRAVLRPAEGAPAYLRFGGDELRLLIVNLMLFIIFIAAYFLTLAMVMIALFATAGPQAAAMAMQGMAMPPVRAIVITAVAALPGIALMVFLYTKLSLAVPQSVGERAIRIFNSWGLTRGIFWPALGAYLLAAVPVLVFGLIVFAVSLALSPGGFNGGVMQALQPDLSSMGAAFSPARLVIYVLQAAAQALLLAAFAVPAATIYAARVVNVADHFGDDDGDED